MSETVEATETSNNTTEVKATSSAQAQLSEEELKKQTDCYFYLHNGCNKGDKCEFRHSEAALSTQTVCRDWVLDNCPRGADCPSRHPSKQTATTFKPKPYFKPGYSAPYHAPHYPTYHNAPQVDRSQTPCYYFLMGQCTKGAACPFSHQFVRAEDANKKSTDDTDKNLKFSVKNDSASEERSNNRNNNSRDESNRSRDRDENSRHSDDGGRQRRSRQEANVVFELPNSRKHEQRARSNSDVKHNNNNNSNNNNKSRDQNNNKNRDQPINRKQDRQDRDSVNSTAVSFAASKEERQKLREQERTKAESAQKASFGVQRLSSLLPGKESVGSKRSRDSAEESPNKRRKVESNAPPSKDDLDRELDELNLPPPANDDEELLDI